MVMLLSAAVKRIGRTLLGEMGISLPTDGMVFRPKKRPIAEAIEKVREATVLKMGSAAERTRITDDCDVLFDARGSQGGMGWVSFIASHKESQTFSPIRISDAGGPHKLITDGGELISISFDGYEARAKIEPGISKPKTDSIGPSGIMGAAGFSAAKDTGMHFEDRTKERLAKGYSLSGDRSYYAIDNYHLGVHEKTVSSPDGRIAGRNFWIKEREESKGRLIFVSFGEERTIEIRGKFAAKLQSMKKGSRIIVEDSFGLAKIPVSKDKVGAETELTPGCSMVYQGPSRWGEGFLIKHRKSGCQQKMDLSHSRAGQLLISDEGSLIAIKAEGDRICAKVGAPVPASATCLPTAADMKRKKAKRQAFISETEIEHACELGSGFMLAGTRSVTELVKHEGKAVEKKWRTYSILHRDHMHYAREFEMAHVEGVREEKVLKLGEGIILGLSMKADGTEVSIAEISPRN